MMTRSLPNVFLSYSLYIGHKLWLGNAPTRKKQMVFWSSPRLSWQVLAFAVQSFEQWPQNPSIISLNPGWFLGIHCSWIQLDYPSRISYHVVKTTKKTIPKKKTEIGCTNHQEWVVDYCFNHIDHQPTELLNTAHLSPARSVHPAATAINSTHQSIADGVPSEFLKTSRTKTSRIRGYIYICK